MTDNKSKNKNKKIDMNKSKNTGKNTTKKGVTNKKNNKASEEKVKKSIDKKEDNKANEKKVKKSIDKKEDNKASEEKVKKSIDKKEDNKKRKETDKKNEKASNINEYVNVLFDTKEEKKSRIANFIIFVFITFIIVFGIYLILNHKDSIIDNIYDKNVHVKDEKKPKQKKIIINKKEEIQNTDKIAILTFHRISTQETKDKYFKDNEWVQSVDMFEQQMKYLHDNNYKTLNLDEFNCWYDGECKFDKKTVVLTFDDGDLSFYYLAAPILKKYNLKATMFIVGSYTKEKEVEYTDTRRLFIAKETLEKSKEEYPNIFYESHSYNFHNSDNKKKAFDMTKEELQEDFDNNKQFGFKYIAYPFGNYDEEVLEIVEENGYIMGFTFRKYDYATRDSKRYEIPRFKINGESDINTLKTILDY